MSEIVRQTKDPEARNHLSLLISESLSDSHLQVGDSAGAEALRATCQVKVPWRPPQGSSALLFAPRGQTLGLLL